MNAILNFPHVIGKTRGSTVLSRHIQTFDQNAILDFISGTDAMILLEQDSDAFRQLVSDLNAIRNFVRRTDAKTQSAHDSDAIYLSGLTLFICLAKNFNTQRVIWMQRYCRPKILMQVSFWSKILMQCLCLTMFWMQNNLRHSFGCI